MGQLGGSQQLRGEGCNRTKHCWRQIPPLCESFTEGWPWQQMVHSRWRLGRFVYMFGGFFSSSERSRYS